MKRPNISRSSYWLVPLAASVLILVGYGFAWSLRPTQVQAAAPSGTSASSTQSGQNSEPASNQTPGVPPEVVLSLPANSWITVLESVPKSEATADVVVARAHSLSSTTPLSVVDTDAVAGLRAGYWAIAITGHPTRQAARAACADVGRPVGGTCYDRRIG